MTTDALRSSMPPPVVTTSLSGLTEDEARSFHGAFMTSFLVFTLIAAVAHWAVWQWRPWIPGVAGYPAATSSAQPAPGPDAATALATISR